jgi:phosphoglycerol transferase MdoB-like AlkP superfamily enzyme
LTKLNRNLGYTACFALCAFAIYGRPGQFPLRWSDAFNLRNDFEANIAFNPFQSFLSSLSFRRSAYDKASLKRYYPSMASYLKVARPDSVNFNFRRTVPKRQNSDTTRPNVVIIICESFSAYKSSMWGNPLNTTPYFDGLSKEGVFFDNCFTPHYGTARGVWATVTGIPDVEIAKTASRNPAMVDQHTIINDFKGYEKFYFLGGSTSWANIRGLLTNNISNLHIYEEGKYDVPRIDVWGISDKNLFLEANKVISRQRQPFFAIIQTADNHRPYTIPEEDLKVFNRVFLPLDTLHKYGFESNDELNAFRYTDFCFRTFVEAARKEAYFSNTVFAFIGDHGISGNAGAMFPKAWTSNGLDSYHVPLLFYSPRRLRPQRLHSVVSQVDMLPTLAGIANISYTNTTMGTDLLHQDTARSAGQMSFIMDHGNNAIGIVKGDYFYTRQPRGNKEELVWANFLKPDPGGENDSIKRAYRELTSAYFETARYMLLNNKKRK